MAASTPLIEARGVHKRFLGVHALNDVDVAFWPGEVVAVVGENGAGKSTLMKCLAGVHEPTEGEIFWQGEPVRIDSVRRAEALGIAFIHQELNLADNLSIGANIFLGREPRCGGLLGWIDRRGIRDRTRRLLEQLGLKESPDRPVSELSIGQQQMVEIAKALSQDAKLLIMDEPTSSLTLHETTRLFELVRQLKREGLCVVFISHRIAEVEAIADRVVVLRDGKNSGELLEGQIAHDPIVSLMVGRDLAVHDHHAPEKDGLVLLEARDLCSSRFPNTPVSFSLRAGEVVGVAGLVGAGRTELARAIFGIDPAPSGEILVRGEPVSIRSPRQAIDAGIAFVPEDRKAQGIITEMSLRNNVAMASLPDLQTARFVRDAEIDALSDDICRRLNIKSTSIHQLVGMLSGGNQQKVVIGKWVAQKPKIFLLDEPTRGIDIRSKGQIYALIDQLAADGAGVLMISSDLEEILRASDRVLVMHEGRLAGELRRDELTEEAVMQLATGALTHA